MTEQKKCIERTIKMYYINILDISNNKTWCEEFDSYYFFRKRVIKLKYSKKLQITSRSNFAD